jgi:hypothetical protein
VPEERSPSSRELCRLGGRSLRPWRGRGVEPAAAVGLCGSAEGDNLDNDHEVMLDVMRKSQGL